jgi:hypothetical protein
LSAKRSELENRQEKTVGGFLFCLFFSEALGLDFTFHLLLYFMSLQGERSTCELLFNRNANNFSQVEQITPKFTV